MRYFEKISFEQFSKDVINDKNLYDDIKIPKRDSVAAAGYDIYLINDIKIKPNEILKIPTGIKSFFEKDEVLLIIVRSSMGFKYNIRLCNQVGVVDSDYYNNKDNEGHIWIRIQNEGDKEVEFKKGQAIVQGLFMKFLATEDDIISEKERRSSY